MSQIKQIKCPSCAADLKLSEQHKTIDCRYCGNQVIVDRAAENNDSNTTNAHSKNQQSSTPVKPSYVSISHENSGISIRYPWRRNTRDFLAIIFPILWLFIVYKMGLSVWTQSGAWVPKVMLTIFIGIGFILIAKGLQQIFNQSEVTLNANGLMIRHTPFENPRSGFTLNQRIELEKIETFICAKNKVFVVLKDQSRIPVCGHISTHPERLFLAQQLNEFLK